MRRIQLCVLFVLVTPVFVFAQSQLVSDPQALSFAAQSIAALTGGNPISDVTLTGTVIWNAGADTGTGTLKALGNAESRMDLALTSGTRTEIRDSQTGTSLGEWINPNNVSGQFAPQNCKTDAVWFFPALGSLATGPNVVLSYIGQETRNSEVVQHIQSYIYQPNSSGTSPTLQQLSTVDFYLDASTLLPVSITFNAHPDNDPTTNLPMETGFSGYQSISGAMIPMHIQSYQQGNLMVDFTVSSASLNTGIALSIFAIN